VFGRHRRGRAESRDYEDDYQPGEEPAGEYGPADGDEFSGDQEPGDEEDLAAGELAEPAGGADGQPAGPWDARDDVPAAERIDFGSLLVPSREGFEVQLSMAEAQGAWVTVVREDSGLQLQAFAAPKSSGLWEDVRQEIAEEVAKAGGSSEEAAGPFGPELRARVVPSDPAGGDRQGQPQPVRFLGVDGPRWFLRGLITGPAAASDDVAAPLEEVFSQVVVVRGDHPVPPRDLLEIQLPEEARQALAEQMEQQQEGEEGGRFQLPDPFERGPEITEIR
jgi:hypothetical protein